MAVRIYVDQGHNPGNINAGASGNGVVESEVTYWVGIYLAGFLYADQRFEVKVSRPFPDTVLGYDQASSLRARVDEANAWPADYFVSIHVNSNPNPAINGSEVYTGKIPLLTIWASMFWNPLSIWWEHATIRCGPIHPFMFCGVQACRQFWWSWRIFPIFRMPKSC